MDSQVIKSFVEWRIKELDSGYDDHFLNNSTQKEIDAHYSMVDYCAYEYEKILEFVDYTKTVSVDTIKDFIQGLISKQILLRANIERSSRLTSEVKQELFCIENASSGLNSIVTFINHDEDDDNQHFLYDWLYD